MPVRGITFDKQVLKSEDHAHEVNYYYQGDVGVTKGCEVTENVDGNLVIAGGYFIICGRLVAVDGNHIVTVPEVLSGTKYRILVFEIDLTEVNTTSVFNQGAFKILESDSGYPTLTQQDLTNGGTLYQMEFARFTTSVSGNASLSEANKPLLDMSKYVQRTSPEFLGHPKAPTQPFNDKTTDIATDEFVQRQVRTVEFSSWKNSSFTLSSSDIGKVIEINTSANLNVTLPLDASQNIPIGSMFLFMVNNFSYDVTFITEDGTMNIFSQDNKKKVNRKMYTPVTAIKYATNSWWLFGDLIA